MNEWLMAATIAVHLPFAWHLYEYVTQDWSARFRRWSMPAHLSWVLIPLEIGSNVMLWLPSSRLIGAILIGLLLLGAIMTMTRYYESRRSYVLPITGLIVWAIWLAVWKAS